MKLISVLRNSTSIALTACCAIGVANARAQTYNLTDLGVLPGQKNGVSTPAAINGKGQVAGTSGASAFRYTKGGKIPMEDVGGNPVGNISRGFGIDGSSRVVGDSTFGAKNATSHAAMFSNGAALDLGTLTYGGSFSRANGINSFGQVVGSASDSRDSEKSRAFIVTVPGGGNGMIDLGTLGGSYAQALAINDSGFVTGNSQTISGTSGAAHAFIWHATTGMLDLGTLDGDFSYGTAINANNHIVGYSTINTVDDRVHAFLFDGEKMLDLGSLGGASPESDRSFALGVNANDQVVGYSYLPSDGPWSVAFIYRQGLMTNLNSLIGIAANNYRLDRATAINDSGQIIAIAFNTLADAFHAVLLTPMRPAPGPKP